MFPTDQLINWFKKNHRPLPFRDCHNPYYVWVSEVMLQQTQVKTMTPYFERWIQAFPTIEKLAKAPLENVLKLWEGLGYYSRARNLHRAAQTIVKQHSGKIPSNLIELSNLPGIGPYTRAAILNFAFHQKEPLIDGNVQRVMARFDAIYSDFKKRRCIRSLESRLAALLPGYQPWVFNEALMELGALICTPQSPKCSKCPLQNECLANKINLQKELPLKPKRKKTIRSHCIALICQYQSEWLVKQQEQGLMKDLFEFPTIVLEDQDALTMKQHPSLLQLQDIALNSRPLKPTLHLFTHHHLTIYPFYFELSQKKDFEKTQWLDENKIMMKAFSAGHRKILDQVLTSGRLQ